MIVGDSISQGSSGDYTWQYRLYEHLRPDGVRPQRVGPVEWLVNNVTATEGDCSYANPRFERANDAVWGRALFQEEAVIGARVAAYHPDYLLVLLGINDLPQPAALRSAPGGHLRSWPYGQVPAHRARSWHGRLRRLVTDGW